MLKSPAVQGLNVTPSAVEPETMQIIASRLYFIMVWFAEKSINLFTDTVAILIPPPGHVTILDLICYCNNGARSQKRISKFLRAFNWMPRRQNQYGCCIAAVSLHIKAFKTAVAVERFGDF